MNPHFFTAPFYFVFILVQGSRFRALVAASPPFFRRWYSRIAAFPTRGRLCVRDSGTLTNAALPCCANKNRSARMGFAERFWFYYSTVTDFARFLGLSTSFPLLIEV